MDEGRVMKQRGKVSRRAVEGKMDRGQEDTPSPTAQAGFLSIDKIAEAVKQHFATEGVVVTEDFTSYDGVPFIVRCTMPAEQGNATAYVYLNLEPDGIVYRLSPGDTEIARSPHKQGTDFEMLKSMSESVKVVKSRPPFLYPELLGVEYEELWPRGAKVAVIGDPYMNCDKEGVTIVEYEFGEEMVPPVLGATINGETEHLYSATMGWAEDMHREDLEALSRIGHPLERPSYGYETTQNGNPYWHAVDDCFRAMGSVSELIGSAETGVLRMEGLDESIEIVEQQLEWTKQVIRKLIDGSWSRSDFDRTIESIENPDEQETAKENLGFYFNLKHRIMDGLGKPEAWTDYIQRWERYLDRLPITDMQNVVPDIDKHVRRVRHWLNELPSITSPQRVTKAFSELEDTYYTLLDWACSQPSKEGEDNQSVWNKPYVRLLYDYNIEGARSIGTMSDGAFGVDIPGYPVSGRTRKFLELAYHRAENAVTYARKIWPKISAEKRRLAETGIQQSAETQLAYLSSFEQALVRSYIPLTAPEKAIPVHGFFPDTVDIDPQDRIVALTSVTMHGWNHLNETGFAKNISDSLRFLKVGGRYILGPINQAVYFGQPASEFDCDGLTQALQDMKAEGLITYRFVKGVREYNDEYSDSPNDREQKEVSDDDQVLLPNESAASLVIERLR